MNQMPRDPAVELELFFPAEHAFEPFCTPFRAAHGQAEMTHDSQGEWHFHG